MSDPLVLIVRFNGNPDELLERFERARRLWIEAEANDYERPIFYAACKSEDGIAIVSGWNSEAAHQAFGRKMGAHLESVGIGRPDAHEHLRIEKLGWD